MQEILATPLIKYPLCRKKQRLKTFCQQNQSHVLSLQHDIVNPATRPGNDSEIVGSLFKENVYRYHYRN
jgi:hypothetical protein